MISVEQIILEVLREDATLAGVVGTRIYAELPEGVARPVVTVESSGGRAGDSESPNWLLLPTVQVDARGVTKASALAAAGAAHDAVIAAPRSNSVTAAGVVTRVTATYPVWIPDDDWPTPNGEPGPRYIMTVRVAAHPNP